MLSGETQLTDSAAGTQGDDTAQLLQQALGTGFTVGPMLGAGTFGMVFRARDLRLERDVAIKTLRREFLVSAEFVRRFEQEARALAALRHPNIVEVYDIGVSNELVYLVMPLVKGETLTEYLRSRRPLPMAEAGRLVHGIAAGLTAAHKAGFVHRDVKPENVMIEGEDHRPLLMDFGIAKAFQSGKAGETRAGSIMGTPLYMSPEQATADPKVDHRSDIYSLGVLAYEVFTGALPFQGETGQDVIHQHVLVAPPDPRKVRPDLSPAASQAILRAMAKKPSERFQSADEFSRVLEGVVRTPGPRPQTSSRARAQRLIRITALVVLAAAAVVAARAGMKPGAGASVAATVRASEVRFTLRTSQPIWGSVAQLQRLAVANLDSIGTPAMELGDWEGGVLYAPVVQLTAQQDSTPGTISIDPIVFPAGTRVDLSGGLSDTTFRLTLGDSVPVLPVSVDGPIQVIAGAPPVVVPFKLQRIQLFPSSTGIDVELRPSRPGQAGLGPLTVSHVSFTKVDKIREGDQARDVLSSTLKGGTIQVTSNHGAAQPIDSGMSVVLQDFEGTIGKIAMDSGGLALSLEGTVQGIPASLGGMPARWRGWWVDKKLQTIALTLVWLGVLVWAVLPRRKRAS